MNTNGEENNLAQETKEFSLRCFIVLLTTIYFFLAYKIIGKRISFIIKKYNINNMFINILGEINIFNTIIVMIGLYFIYYIGKNILSHIFKQQFEITNLKSFLIDSF